MKKYIKPESKIYNVRPQTMIAESITNGKGDGGGSHQSEAKEIFFDEEFPTVEIPGVISQDWLWE